MYLQLMFTGLKDGFATRRKITKFGQNKSRMIFVTTNVNPTVQRDAFILRIILLCKFSSCLLLASSNRCKVV
jgi:hypothetical protein